MISHTREILFFFLNDSFFLFSFFPFFNRQPIHITMASPFWRHRIQLSKQTKHERLLICDDLHPFQNTPCSPSQSNRLIASVKNQNAYVDSSFDS